MSKIAALVQFLFSKLIENRLEYDLFNFQEAVRWTEMIRASKTTDTPIDKKNKQGIWKL